jgi:plasmid stabilization system protein ParE
MSRFVLTPAADRDVRDIVAYIAEQSGMAAGDRLDEELHAAMVAWQKRRDWVTCVRISRMRRFARTRCIAT